MADKQRGNKKCIHNVGVFRKVRFGGYWGIKDGAVKVILLGGEWWKKFGRDNKLQMD